MTTETQNNITIAALTGGVNTPSSRFRVRQYIPRLADHNVIVDEIIPYFEKSCGLPSPFKTASRIPAIFRSRKADIIWLNKELVQGYATFERLLKRPRVLDADDSLWLNPPLGKFAIPHIAKGMDAVIAGNSYLADYFSRYCDNIHIVPTAIDLDRYQLRKTAPSKFVIGWTGLACNYQYMDTIADALKSFLTDHKDAELMLLSNRPWQTADLPAGQVRFVPWTKENETTALHEMSVGIMPLPDTKWTKGKCGFKMLQYMAAALPVIVSPVGMNRDILEKGSIGFAATSSADWYDALKTLYNDQNLQTTQGKQGRKVIEEHYNADKIAAKLANIFKSLI